MGPACVGLRVFTFLRNLSIPMGVKGTPKSGQLVKCSCETSRGALQPSGSCCGDTGMRHVSRQDHPHPPTAASSRESSSPPSAINALQAVELGATCREGRRPSPSRPLPGAVGHVQGPHLHGPTAGQCPQRLPAHSLGSLRRLGVWKWDVASPSPPPVRTSLGSHSWCGVPAPGSGGLCMCVSCDHVKA